jgi:hydroxysqualene synthase
MTQNSRLRTRYNLPVSRWPAPLARAYAACADLARAHYENFPVASRLLPAAMRPHIAAVYAFARVADDLADEGEMPAVERRRQLDAWQARLHRAAAGSRTEGDGERDDLIFTALGHSIRTLDLPLSLFDDLLSAFGQDTIQHRYASWPEVLDYCRRSANPIGRLVLRIAGYRNDVLDESSDALCTALQLTNFWQDFGRDWRAGRLYVPREVQDGSGARESELGGAALPPAWARAIQACTTFTRAKFLAGRVVCDGVYGRLRAELRLTWLGGWHLLARVERDRCTLLSSRPTVNLADLPLLLWCAVRWRRPPGHQSSFLSSEGA